jgi:hypothetical protein
MTRTTVVAVTGLLAIAGLAVVGAQSRPAPQSEDIMPALLAEVRGLRTAMEQMAAAGPRVQLALGRLQMQEQRVNNSIRRLDEVRGKLTAAQRQAAEHQERSEMHDRLIKELQSRGATRVAGENGPPLEDLQQMSQSIRNELTWSATEVQRLLAEEATVANEVATEQSRWTVINQQLEDIERVLGGTSGGVRR